VTFGVHQNGAPLLLGEGVQSSLQAVCALGELELVLRAWGLVGDCLELGRIPTAGTSAPLSAPRVQTDVARDAERPGAERNDCIASLTALEDAPKHFGDAIIDLCAAGTEAEQVARDGHDGGTQRGELMPRLDVGARGLLGPSA
jgi:hypothetical protein